MSTNSIIGMKCDDGRVRAVYCYRDGNIEWVGRILAINYRSTAKVAELISLGNLSSLGSDLERDSSRPHTWKRPMENLTVAYHRDLQEPLLEAEVFESVDAYAEAATGCFRCFYVYLFEPDGSEGSWSLLDEDGRHNVYEIIREAMEADD